MAKATIVKAVDPIIEPMKALAGNTHFRAFMDELRIKHRYGKTVFDVDSRKTTYLQGRQDVVNDLTAKQKAIATSEPPQ